MTRQGLKLMDLVNSPGAKQTPDRTFTPGRGPLRGPPAQETGARTDMSGALSQEPAGSCRGLLLTTSPPASPTPKAPTGPGRASGGSPGRRLPVFWALTALLFLLVSGCRRDEAALPVHGLARVRWKAQPGPGSFTVVPSTRCPAEHVQARRVTLSHPAAWRRHTEQTLVKDTVGREHGDGPRPLGSPLPLQGLPGPPPAGRSSA